MFSPFSIPHKGTSHSLSPSSNSLNKRRLLKTKACKVCFLQAISAFSPAAKALEKREHKTLANISTKDSATLALDTPAPGASFILSRPPPGMFFPSPQAIQVLHPCVVQEALLDLFTELLSHSLALPLALFIISCFGPLWLFSPIRLFSSPVALGVRLGFESWANYFSSLRHHNNLRMRLVVFFLKALLFSFWLYRWPSPIVKNSKSTWY